MKIFLLLSTAAVPSLASALTVRLDYTHDDYFTNPSNPYASAATAAIEAAAFEISTVLGNSYSPITNDTVSGTSNGTTANIRANYNYIDPQDSSITRQRSAAGLQQDEIVIYVGAQTLGNFTFAEASPGIAGIQIGGGGSGANWAAAVSAAEAAANQRFGRGGETTLSTISSSATLGGTTASFDISFGPAVGSMWFNDSLADDIPGQAATRDSWEVNNNFWHFDHTTPVGTGKLDMYSVALHEIIHVLGYGTSENWENFVTGNQWTGPEVTAILGEGVPALEDDLYHILDGLQSPGYLDGILRQTVMNSSPVVGQRDQLTVLDLAYISDMSYNVVVTPVPEPTSSLLISAALFLGLSLRRRAC